MDRYDRWEKYRKTRKKITTPLAIGFWVGVIGVFLSVIYFPDKELFSFFAVVGALCGIAWIYIWPIGDEDSPPEDF